MKYFYENFNTSRFIQNKETENDGKLQKYRTMLIKNDILYINFICNLVDIVLGLINWLDDNMIILKGILNILDPE